MLEVVDVRPQVLELGLLHRHRGEHRVDSLRHLFELLDLGLHRDQRRGEPASAKRERQHGAAQSEQHHDVAKPDRPLDHCRTLPPVTSWSLAKMRPTPVMMPVMLVISTAPSGAPLVSCVSKAATPASTPAAPVAVVFQFFTSALRC